MKKKILIGSIIAIAIIVLSSFSSVVGKVSSDSDLVEFDVEFCGLGKKHTVQLTQQEAEEVELLFDDMQDKLSAVKSDDETMAIFNEAVVELDKYGLLGGLSVRLAQRFITYQQVFQRIVKSSELSDNENYFCLISGKLTNTYFLRPFIKLYLSDYFSENFVLLYEIMEFLYSFQLVSTIFNFPLRLYSSISIGEYWGLYEWTDVPANGWIFTIGLNGIKEWEGKLFGSIDSITIMFGDRYYLGVDGFTGIKIYNPQTKITSFVGKARHVKIDYW